MRLTVCVRRVQIYEINKGFEGDAARKVYEGMIYPLLKPHQKVWQVPGLFADPRLPRNESEKILLDKIDGFWSWAQNDTKVAGINPWHWETWGSMASTSPEFQLGAREFPALKEKLAEIGAAIKAGQGGGYGGLGRKMPRA